MILGVTFCVVLGVATYLTVRVADLPLRAAELTRSLDETGELNLDLREGIQLQLRLVRRLFDEADRDFPRRFTQLNFELGEKQTRYLRLRVDLEERLAVERVKQVQAELAVRAQQVYALVRAGDSQSARLRFREMEDLAFRIDQDFALLSELQLRKLDDTVGQLHRSVLRGELALGLAAGGVAVVLVLFGLLLRRRVLRPLGAILEASRRLRKGDFSVRAEEGRGDEIGRLAQGFNYMAEALAASHADLERRVEERTRQLEQLQEQLVQAAKMSAVGQLVSGVAHELNNPLTVIMGASELAAHRLDGTSDPAVARAFDTVLEQAERCRKIVAALAQFARPQKPELERVDLNAVVERVLQLREYQLKTHDISVTCDYDSACPSLAADPHKLEQVVLNLLNNAVDAIEGAGRGGRIWLRTATEGDHVVLEVRDDGPGIREPDRVFEPFYTTKQAGDGTWSGMAMGMGLAISYGIVNEHGGEIHAGNWGGGAAFVVTLPVVQLEEGSRPSVERKAELALPGGATALVVEDEEMLADLQRGFLEDAGVDAYSAASGEEAIRFLEEKSVDLVISDVRMPGRVNGIDLFRWVQEHRPELQHRFVLVSGDMAGLENRRSYSDLGVPFLQKPFTFQRYAEVVRQMLAEESVSP